jgi:hypothetical protein
MVPAMSRWCDAATRVEQRHHLLESAVQRGIRRAAIEAGMTKRITWHAVILLPRIFSSPDRISVPARTSSATARDSVQGR